MKLGFWEGIGIPLGLRFGTTPIFRELLPQGLLTTPLVLFEGFENFSDWGLTGGSPTLSDDGTIKVQGTNALHVITAAGANAIIDKTTSFVTSGNVRLAVYFPDAASFAATNGLNLYLSETANFSKYFTVSIIGWHTGWNVVNLVAADWTNSGGANWANPVIRMRINISRTAQCIANFDAYQTVGAVYPAAMITFDDVHTSIYANAFPYMRSKNMVGSIYVISDNIGTAGYENATNLQIMNAQGWDIGNHTKTHTNLTTLTQGQIQTELSACKGVLDGLGLTRASSHVAYPFGSVNDTVYAAMTAESMLSGRRVVNPTSLLAPATRLVLPIYDYRAIPAFDIDSSVTLATAKGYVDRALARGEIITFLFHQLVASGAGANQWNIPDFQALIDYVKANNMRTLTISELYALESGDVVIYHA